ncbi:MAG: PAS domain S-box protein [Verrucomicrobia subdivision 3 bacterium]|nr:PAS domain S-box protein [Limisphaerales bacterium]
MPTPGLVAKAGHNAEAALRASEAIKSAILATALDCIITIDHEGRVLDFNPAAERTFGYSRDEAIGREMADLIIPPYLRERHRAGLKRAVTSGRDTIMGQRIEIAAVRKNGEEFPVELAITRIATNGAPIFTGHIRDITERKEAETRRATQLAVTRVLAEALSIEEAAPRILRTVCESLGWDLGNLWQVEGDLLCSVDVWHAPESPLAEFGEATRRMTFSTGIGLPGRVWATKEPHWIADVTKDANFPRAVSASHAGLHAAFSFPIHLDGQVLGVLEFFSREIRQPNNEVLEMFVTIGGQMGQFIERKRAERHVRELNADLERRINEAVRGLRESQERFSKAFRASPVYMSIARLSDGRFLEVNEAFLHASGYTCEEVIDHTSVELGIWPDLDKRESFLAEVRRCGFVRDREIVLRSKDGQAHTFLLSAELIEVNGDPHVLAVSMDITTRKRAEEDMRRTLEREKGLSRLKTNFVALVSHEFRTPLGIIMSSADILRKYFDRLPADRRREHLQDIHNASQRMADLMDEVLLLARVEAGRMECRPALLDLREFCQRIAESIRSSHAETNPIEISASKITASSAADESLLRHIFTNLLSNAVKYSPPGSPVRFKIERQGREAVFTVVDSGIGIPAADRAELFQSFHRGANVGERPGTGLGLVIVKRCVELHGGCVDLQSRENQGTTVTVRLPLFDAGPAKELAHSQPRKQKSPVRRSSKA